MDSVTHKELVDTTNGAIDILREYDISQLRRPAFGGAGLYSLSKNQIGGLPRDQARQFFISHQTRLRNLGKGRMEESERALLSIRAGNIKTAETVYKELQQQALGIKDKPRSGARENRGR